MRTILLALGCFLASTLWALEPRFNIVSEKMNTASMPFKTVNNLIICKLRINDSDTLHFILDSGAKNTILFLKDPDNNPLNKSNIIPAYIRGVGWQRDSLKAYMSEGNTIYLPGIEGRAVDIAFVSARDFDISSFLGCHIDGIIGADIFQQLIVRVNYAANHIQFHNPGTVKHSKKYLPLPLDIENNKAYVRLPVQLGTSTFEAKLLIDLGESKPVSLLPGTHPLLSFPEKFTMASLGIGLGGAISGYIAKIPGIQIGNHHLHNVIASFPDEESLPAIQLGDGRQGSLGAGILQRFECVIDFPGKHLYLRKSGKLNKPFLYNRLGAELIAVGEDYSSFQISHIIPLTPADLYGLQENDQILAVNGKKTRYRTIDLVWRWINNDRQDEVSLKVLRNGQVEVLNIHLFNIL